MPRGSLVPERVLGVINTTLAVFASAGEAHSACLDESGKLYTWGMGTYGRLGTGEESDQLVPVLVSALTKVQMMTVSCGAFHTSAVSLEGEMYVFGGGLYGKLGNESEENCILPQKVMGNDIVSSNSYTQVACGTFHTVAINEEGKCLTWGFWRPWPAWPWFGGTETDTYSHRRRILEKLYHRFFFSEIRQLDHKKQ